MSEEDISQRLTEMAQEAIREGRDEEAALLLWKVGAHFGMLGDEEKFKELNGEAGRCYLRAAERLWENGKGLEASLLYIKAAKCFKNSGDEGLAQNCDRRVREYYSTLEGDLAVFTGTSRDLKLIGDYFRARGSLRDAGRCYHLAAERAEEEGRQILSGGFYRDAGDCFWHLGDPLRAAQHYEAAAERYSEASRYFEAAWHYNIAGFLFIIAEEPERALSAARKANVAYLRGEIPTLFNSLSKICEFLAMEKFLEAEEEWLKVKRKFKRTYVDLIDSCFDVVRRKRGRGERLRYYSEYRSKLTRRRV